ncbi:MAG: aminoglycoside phosphotransferase family protein [Verrucomicrobia bacterium]|nr:aminoglycoside phosphotransferase family protein [Verrucomicrobiota bacterium]
MKKAELPTEEHAAFLVRSRLGTEPVQVQRFETGLCHFVYRVETSGGPNFVVRISRPETLRFLEGGVYWSKLLRPMGVPLPEILFVDLAPPDSIFPFVILEFLEGTDLGTVYPALSSAEKLELASEVIRIQQSVASLPNVSRFGYAFSYEAPPNCRSWKEVMLAIIERAQERMNTGKHPGRLYPERVKQSLSFNESYFASVRPIAFLEDITTKNVLVHQGRINGMVDVDQMCFGDSLLTIGETRMALLQNSFDLDYVEHWMHLLKLDSEQRRVVNFYTLWYCVVFMSELGEQFNRAESKRIDLSRYAYLESIYERLAI